MQFEFLSPKMPPLIGVDISASSVKLVELAEAGKGQYRVERYVIEPLPKDLVTDGNITNVEQVAEVLESGWKKLGTRVKHIALALPHAAVIQKKIILPAGLAELEMEQQVESEASQYIPFALDEVNLDFQILGPSAANPEEVEVLLAASRKEKVEEREAVAEAAGLKPQVMDVESNATQTSFELIAHQLPNNARDQAVAIVDIGANNMHINVFLNNQSVYFREQSFGGNQLTQDIQRRFNLSPEEAELGKRNGGLPEAYESEVLQPFMDTLGQEVSRALQFFFSSTQFSRVDHIILAGGCAMIPGLDETVSNRTQVSTMIANPFVSMALSAKVKARQLAMDAPALLVACGLAMRRFDE